MQYGHWQISNERCLTLYLPSPVTLEKQQLCWGLADQVMTLDSIKNDLVETVLGMNTLSVYTKPVTASRLLAIAQVLQDFCQQNPTPKVIKGKHVDIPVHYGGEYGIDLPAVAKLKNTTVADIVAQHTAPIYTVYFIGFQAGFPYLGGLPEALHTPRHAVPRSQVPAGSVGIGGSQTGIYPFASPGGWQLLGRTDIALFDLANAEPTLLQAGDTLSFVAVAIES